MATLGLWSLSLGPPSSKHGGTVSRNDNGGSGDKAHPERHGKATVKRQGKERKVPEDTETTHWRLLASL